MITDKLLNGLQESRPDAEELEKEEAPPGNDFWQQICHINSERGAYHRNKLQANPKNIFKFRNHCHS